MLTRSRNSAGWQVILADLALILFLLTAAALSEGGGAGPGAGAARGGPTGAEPLRADAEVIAPAQSLYRAGPGLPSFAEWIAEQPRDPRAALTIVAQHRPGEATPAWRQARAMANSAAAAGVRARVIIREGEVDEIHASLAYDQPGQAPADAITAR